MLILTLLLVDNVSSQDLKIDWENNQLVVSLTDSHVERLNEQSEDLSIAQSLRIRLKSSLDNQILGRVQFNKSKKSLTFRPRFPLDAGTILVVEVGNEKSLIAKTEFKIPGANQSKRTRVVQIYPSARKLPANILKFYVHFSSGMQRGNIYRHFSIVDVAADKEVELPFLELEQELWSRDGLRLTLFFDPGRIKRGLKPREQMGPIFVPGKTYEFRISGKWKDSNGREFGKDIVKTFVCTDEDFKTPNQTKWQLSSPATESRQPLTVRFDEALDSALVSRVLSIRRNGKKIPIKSIEFVQNESQVKLVPAGPWIVGNYVLEIGSELEDLCGNRIGKPFDVDLDKKPTKDQSSENRSTYEVSFKLSPPIK